jgi:hypothetical protein
MAAGVMGVPNVMHLETECVLQVARLFGVESGHDSGALGDVYHDQVTRLGHGVSELAKLSGRWRVVRLGAAVELDQGADVADTAHEVLRNSDAEASNAASIRCSSVSGITLRRAVSPYGSGKPFAR